MLTVGQMTEAMLCSGLSRLATDSRAFPATRLKQFAAAGEMTTSCLSATATANSNSTNEVGSITSVLANQNQRHVSSLDLRGNLLICSAGNVLRPIFTLLVDVREVRAVHFLDRHTILATAIHEGQCILVDVLSPSKPLWRRRLRHRIGESAISRDCRYLSITNLASAVQVYEVIPTGVRLLHEFSSPTKTSNNFPLQTCFAEAGSLVLAGSDNGEVRAWDLRSGKKTLFNHPFVTRPPKAVVDDWFKAYQHILHHTTITSQDGRASGGLIQGTVKVVVVIILLVMFECRLMARPLEIMCHKVLPDCIVTTEPIHLIYNICFSLFLRAAITRVDG
ncbi:hypothetical protein AURDEDRAFT_131824 [Auricularia subglabra TFB-10046 SS5]|uniref:WD40 repeat-like protein n=1 Tax=Auricularia subglabra (strain TFB-10046 / SS5) TaxID=717982 RepID=J0WMV6_AURST|nr:hypothetical protein AURDEDRAFT_131824 [Auricularia subglabra TFB-10046 SS5]